ncbi:sensory transduction protein LytR [Kordia sp. SMS9]|uniref:LytR/AlgR family response regulator transcription factor n=1 Tax=Kordia sp. SMS9 TaxID=2282170 RepID=UPI000E0CE4FC|nr:LytTR family DNA-binding domain-containing protein [Kordia sp. SMS9]AXG68909.1 sensory transduction protein LytR [Kordia sp. SMS9]
MNILNCILIDDEPLARKGLQAYCDAISFLNVVGVCKNALQANEILHQQSVDLIFLDINMPIVSGLDWLKSLASSPPVIMTTAYPQYALESFSYEVIDYLVKPISFERFLQAVNKVYRLTKTTEDEQVFFVKSDKSLKKIHLNEILFVEAMQNYVKIVTTDETIVTHSTLKQLRDHLPDSIFVQTHKSYLISKTHVSEITGNQIVIGDHTIPISVRLKKEVLQQILDA